MNKINTKLIFNTTLVAIMAIGMIAATTPSPVFAQSTGGSSTEGHGGSSSAQSGSTNGGNGGHGGNNGNVSSFSNNGSNSTGNSSGSDSTHGVGCSPLDPRC
jgi:hypothetical protein